jgi:hypothetical protein
MVYPTRHGFPTHGDCVNFRNGICTINGVAVDPNGSICPNFIPKGTMVTQPKARVHPQTRKTYNAYASRIQSYPQYMPSYPPPTSHSLLTQTGYDYRNQYADNPTPSTPTARKVDNILFLSMSRSRGGRGMRRGRMGGFMAGPGGSCVCPKCEYTTPHTTSTPCYQQTCPKCGSRMTRGT